MHRLSLRDFNEAHTLLQTLIDRGVNQPAPYAWLANWHVLRVGQGWSEDERQDAFLAMDATKRALDLDADCSLALAVDGFVHTHLLKRFDVARERYQRAIMVNPNDSLAWLLKGTLHAFMDEGSEAVDSTQRAIKLTPLDPHRFFYHSLAASACLSAGQFDRALELAQRSLRENRVHASTLRAMAAAQWNLGLHEDARTTVRELLRIDPALTVSRYRERHPATPYRFGELVSGALRSAGVPE
jgi:tetratricopeptide (TPR) repeat protein